MSREHKDELIVRAAIKLFRYDDQYVACPGEFHAAIYDCGGYNFMLRIETKTSSGPVVPIAVPVHSRIMLKHTKNEHSFNWVISNTINGQLVPTLFLARFVNLEDENPFMQSYFRCLTETHYRQPISKILSGDDEDFLLGADDVAQGELKEEDDVEMEYEEKVNLGQSYVEEEEESEGEEEEEEPEEEEEGSESEEESEEDSPQKINKNTRVFRTPAKKGSHKNTQLAVGHRDEYAFVSRGSRVGVFRQEDDQMKFVNSIKKISDKQGRDFTPQKMMLYDNEKKMLLLNPDRVNSVFELDLERGEVVSEFGGDKEFKIREITHKSKYGQRTHEATIIGVNHNSVFTIDPRVNTASKVVTSQSKTYVSTNPFTAVCTTGDGFVAAATNRGEIRLYDDLSKSRAKSLIPGTGDEIRGLDVTTKGDWVLATSKYYLLVINTMADEVKSGFQKSCAKTKKATKLTLSLADIEKYRIAEVDFTPAHFNIGGGDEQWIVTSTGPYIITWSLNKVKAGRTDYTLKKTVNNVVADHFTFNHDDRLIVTLPDNVYLEQTKPITKSQKR